MLSLRVLSFCVVPHCGQPHLRCSANTREFLRILKSQVTFSDAPNMSSPLPYHCELAYRSGLRHSSTHMFRMGPAMVMPPSMPPGSEAPMVSVKMTIVVNAAN